MKGHFVEPQEIAPQRFGGVDHSAKGVVLVRAPGVLLVWRKSGKCWAGIGFDPSYVPVRLQVIATRDAKNYEALKTEDIFEGGKLAMYRIAADMKKIRAMMQLPNLDVQHIHPKKTYVVDER